MLIRTIAVGTRMPDWVEQATAEYAKRLPPEIRFEMVEIKAEARGKDNRDGNVQQWLQREAQRIRSALPNGAHVVVLDEHGTDLTTRQLSQRLATWRQQSQPVAIVIGGPDGLDASVKALGHEDIRLSSLTLPHPLVRVLLAEQLFRACSILSNHPYHRG